LVQGLDIENNRTDLERAAMKTAKHYLEEANGQVKRITPQEAIQFHGDGTTLYIDVRDSSDIAKSGTIKGAVKIPRGFMEFAADDATPHFNGALNKNVRLCLVCGAGGQAALAGKTLLEMGYKNVINIGGFSAWKDAGGPTE
jgi:rhodanese-related sulfurtransferase